MPKEQNDIKEMLNDIKQDAQKLGGWDEIQVIEIHKYGSEAVVKTDKGSMKISMRDLFTQYYFILKVFETFGISLSKVKDKIYEQWRGEWSKTIKDMSTSDGSSLDLLRESLNTYSEQAEERSTSYLKTGEVILLKNNVIAFRSNDFGVWLKKKCSINYTDDQLHATLRDLGCEPRQIGPERIRAWTYRIEEVGDITLLDE
jgi:hypothetical protein